MSVSWVIANKNGRQNILHIWMSKHIIVLVQKFYKPVIYGMLFLKHITLTPVCSKNIVWGTDGLQLGLKNAAMSVRNLGILNQAFRGISSYHKSPPNTWNKNATLLPTTLS